MIEYYIIGRPISTVGEQLNLKGKELLVKEHTAYLEGKGWISLKTVQQIKDNYRLEDVSNESPVLLPVLSEVNINLDKPSYEQQLLDKVAAENFNLLLKQGLSDGHRSNLELASQAYNNASAFILERKKYLV